MWISRKKYEEMVSSAAGLLNSLEKLKHQAILIGIERKGKLNVFTFSRNGELYQIETYGTLGDNLPEWKDKLLR
jgi:hypothetical protein